MGSSAQDLQALGQAATIIGALGAVIGGIGGALGLAAILPSLSA
ncbi:Uncharacterised protein [Nocardia africana]|uniref:Uncharacterized protein n=1 Tax=Nocardia africana TaxID=134964 RepID=A0A378WW85_9NOCA|nr:Uncharacterised protein [Nocardia africana]